MKLRTILAIAFLLSAVCLHPSAHAAWGSENCIQGVINKLTEKQINLSATTNVIHTEIWGGKESGKVVGYSYWFQFSDCPGYLVASVYRNQTALGNYLSTCDYDHMHVYSRRGCKFEGISYWRW